MEKFVLAHMFKWSGMVLKANPIAFLIRVRKKLLHFSQFNTVFFFFGFFLLFLFSIWTNCLYGSRILLYFQFQMRVKLMLIRIGSDLRKWLIDTRTDTFKQRHLFSHVVSTLCLPYFLHAAHLVCVCVCVAVCVETIHEKQAPHNFKE